MIDKRTIELINGAMDDELSGAEMAELDAFLAQSEEARRYQAGLREMNSLLNKLPPMEMPFELHGKIVRNTKLPARPATRPQASVAGWPGFIRYGLAATAGLVLAVGIYEFGSNTPGPQDLNRMIGTMAPGHSGGVVLEKFSFADEGVSSTVSLERRNGALLLVVELDSAQAIELDVDFGGANLVFDAVAQIESNLDSIEFSGQAVRARSRGQQRFAVLLHRGDNAANGKDAPIQLEYSSNGRSIKHGTLVPRW